MQNKIEFEARPVEIHVKQNRGEFAYADFTLKGDRDATLALNLSDKDMKLLFVEDVDPVAQKYRVTIENVTKIPDGAELLQSAANNAKVGFTKKAVEQAIKALQKLAESK